MGKGTFTGLVFIFAAWVVMPVGTRAEQEADAPSATLQAVRVELQKALASSLNALSDVSDIAELLFGTPLDSDRARQLIKTWRNREQEGARLLLLDTEGRVLATAGSDVEETPATLGAWGEGGEGEPSIGVGASRPGEPLTCHTLFPLYGADGEHRGSLCLLFAAAPLLRTLVAELDLDEDSTLFVLLPDGRIAHASDADGRPEGESFGSREPGRRGVLGQMRDTEWGATVFAKSEPGAGHLATRRVEWLQCPFMGTTWILALEWGAETPDLLTGRWVGAYSLESGGGGRSAKEGGSFSVQIDRAGDVYEFRAMLGQQEIRATGIMVGHRIAAADVKTMQTGHRAVWYWRGSYDPDKDALRGEIDGNTVNRVSTWSYFLRRVEGRGSSGVSQGP